MSKVSVIIPARNEPYLQQTIDSIFRSAKEPIEIVVVLDNFWPQPILRDNPRLRIIHRGEVRGMRDAIDSAVSVAQGDFLLKSDAHCHFARGFDSVLKAQIENNWIVIPRRYSLDVEKWKVDESEWVDYHYLSFPFRDDGEIGMHGRPWRQRQKERANLKLDEEMMSQGSCWFMTREHFDSIGGLQEEGYGTFTQEMTELSCKTWLSGGAMMVNKETWYAHPRQMARGYTMGRTLLKKGAHYATDFWLNDRWQKQVRPFSWLVEHFAAPWPADWQARAKQYHLEDGLLVKGDTFESNHRVLTEQVQSAV